VINVNPLNSDTHYLITHIQKYELKSKLWSILVVLFVYATFAVLLLRLNKMLYAL